MIYDVHPTPAERRPVWHDPTRPTRLLNMTTVLERCGISRSFAFEAMRAREFLAPCKVGNRNLWIEQQLEFFLVHGYGRSATREELKALVHSIQSED